MVLARVDGDEIAGWLGDDEIAYARFSNFEADSTVELRRHRLGDGRDERLIAEIPYAQWGGSGSIAPAPQAADGARWVLVTPTSIRRLTDQGQVVRTIDLPNAGARLAPNGRAVFGWREHGTDVKWNDKRSLFWFDLATERTWTVQSRPSWRSAAAISPDGSIAATTVSVGTGIGSREHFLILGPDGVRDFVVPDRTPIGDLDITVDGWVATVVDAEKPDARGLIVWGPDRRVRWSSEPPAEAWTHDDAFHTVAFARDGKTLAAGTLDGRIILFDAASGRVRRELGSPLRFADDARLVNGQLVVQHRGARSGLVRWNLATGVPAFDRVIEGRLVAIDVDARDRIVQVWRANDATCSTGFAHVLHDSEREIARRCWQMVANKRTEADDETEPALAARASRVLLYEGDGNASAYQGIPGGNDVLDWQTGKVTALDPRRFNAWRTYLTPDGTRAFATGRPYDARGTWVVIVWNVKDGAIAWTAPTIELAPLVVSPDSRWLAYLRQRDEIVIAEIATGRERSTRLDAWDVRALAFTSDGSLVVGGRTSDGEHLGIVRDGKLVAASPPTQHPFKHLSVEVGDRRVASVASDGTVGLWDLVTPRLLATFASFEDDEWIISTPQGPYHGTMEVSDRIGWAFETPPEVFGFAQYAALADTGAVIEALAGRATPAPRVERPPRVELRDVATGHLRVHVRSHRRVDHVRAFVEGRPVAERAVCANDADVTLAVPTDARGRVAVVAFDDLGVASNAASAELSGPVARKPDLWIVAIGIGRYPKLPPDAQLHAAGNDARGVAEAFGSLEGSVFGAVHRRELVDEDATPARILSALRTLTAMRPDDLAIVFFAGHGFKLDEAGDMVFATSGLDLRRPTTEAVVSWADINLGLAGAKGRLLVLLDACHAGHISRELALPDELATRTLFARGRAGAVIFAASKGRQPSFEPNTARALVRTNRIELPRNASGSHGVFTGALLEMLAASETDADGNGAIELSELVDAVTRRVSVLTHGVQTPWIARRETVGDFAIVPARAR